MKKILLLILLLSFMFVYSSCSNNLSQSNQFPPPAGYSSWEQYNLEHNSSTTTTTQTSTTQTVVLNYGTHKSVAYQYIKDRLAYYFNRDIQWSKEDGYEYQLVEIVIENQNINVFLELRFQPSSKAWLIHDAYSWLWLAACTGLDVDGETAGIVYSTGYDISVILSTPLSGGNIVSWGTAKIENSGAPFDDNSINRERIWIDGPGMELLN